MSTITGVDRKGETVVPLLRYHPILHVFEPVEFAGFTELWIPVHFFGGFFHLGSNFVHVDEPFVDQAKYELGGASPADRVAVSVFVYPHQ